MAKILVVDDDSGIRLFIQAALENEGYEVKIAKNALEGLTLMRNGLIPDLLITDLLMSVMDGCTLIKEMRQDVALVDIPALIITGCMPKMSVLPDESQFQGLLIKPFDLDVFLATIRKLLKKNNAA